MRIPATSSIHAQPAIPSKVAPLFGMTVALREASQDVSSFLAAQSAKNRASLYRAFLKALTGGDQAAMKGFLMMPPVRSALSVLAEKKQLFLLGRAHSDVFEMLEAALLKIRMQATHALPPASSGRKQIR